MRTYCTTLRILELCMNTTGPIRIGVACNIHTVGAIVVVISTEAGRTLLRIPLVVVLGVNSCHLQQPCLLYWFSRHICLFPLYRR